MIYTERKITISNSGASIDSPIILYRGDKEIEILFTIVDSKFKFSSEKGNYIINTGAKFAQLAVDLPDGTDLFTDISECLDGAVIFKITGDMIDEIREIGFYSFHIRLFDESRKSRITIPPVLKGIEIKSPMVTESTVGYATADNSRVDDNEESFIDEDGKLTIEWKKGDVISSVKLNQMVEVVNNAVDEEKQRQQNELVRQNNEEIRQDAIEYAVETYDMTINELNAEKNKIKPYVDDILGKEIDKIKKLEESTVSTITTDNDFTCVENTSNGYFEDVKLEGRTLANLYPKLDAKNYEDLSGTISDDTITINADGNWHNFKLKKDVLQLKASTYYTFVIDIIENTLEGDDNFPMHFGETLESDPSKFTDEYLPFLQNKKGIYTFKLKTKDSFDNINNDTRDFLSNAATGGTIVFKYMILEGDHTQNPPEYFEGLKSVGQDVDEISVLSCNENCSDGDLVQGNETEGDRNATDYIRVNPSKEVYINGIDNSAINVDKKRILYYNDETQTWEKPVLREWDSIEKHSDGKYYYHKRSGEVVLNGSEEWVLNDTQENTCRYRVRNENIKNSSKLIADRCMFRGDLAHGDYEYIFMNDALNLYININKSKLSSQDAQGFKNWLQANPTTVAYELAEEKVYECTSINLITYDDETNYIVTAGSIAPISTLKVMCNVTNVVRELEQKVSNLENYIQHVMIDALNNALNE